MGSVAGMTEEKKAELENPILYKCPYCTKGRFTKDDGWEAAVRHIEEVHRGRGAVRCRNVVRRSTRGVDDPHSVEDEFDN